MVALLLPLVPPGTTPRDSGIRRAAVRVLVLKVVCCAAGVRVRQPVHVLQAACCAKGRAAVFCGRLPSALREGMRNLLYYVIIIVHRDRSPPRGCLTKFCRALRTPPPPKSSKHLIGQTTGLSMNCARVNLSIYPDIPTMLR